MARLLRAQKIAGTPDLQVAKGDLEARTQGGELFDRLQSAGCAAIHAPAGLGWVEQHVGIGAGFRAPHAATQLVQFGQAVVIGLVDENGVGGWNIKPALDDGGGDEDVSLAVEEANHRILQFVAVHLAMRHHHAGLRHDFAQPFSELVDVLHPGVDEENLPITVKLAEYRVADQAFVEA